MVKDSEYYHRSLRYNFQETRLIGVCAALLLPGKSWMGLPEVEDWEVQQEKEDEELEADS
jgi:hypothetical protein